MHVVYDPGRAAGSGQLGPAMLPSAFPSASASAIPVSWLDTRPIDSLCTIHDGGYPTPRNTRFRLVATLAG